MRRIGELFAKKNDEAYMENLAKLVDEGVSTLSEKRLQNDSHLESDI